MLPLLARTFFRIQERMLGRRAFAILKELEQSQWWSRTELDELRLQRLQSLATSAYEHSSYWRGIMDEHAIRPEEIRSLDDLKSFPLLNKDWTFAILQMALEK